MPRDMTEFCAAPSVKVRLGQLSPPDRAEVLAVFAELVEGPFEVLPVSRLDFRTAARFAAQHAAGLGAESAVAGGTSGMKAPRCGTGVSITG